MTECGICTDPYNKVRMEVECPRCQASACTRCVKTYLMNNTIIPKCMGCQSAWDMEFVRKILSKSFLDTEYKKHQISALLSQAEASLGEMQCFVPIRERLDVLTERIKTEKTRSDRCLENEKTRLMNAWNTGSTTDDPSDDKAVFFMACPRKECRGRVSSVYKCGLCQHWACPDCHGDKGLERNGPHECTDENRKTVRMLKQNTKNCPECHEGIFKEYGCDQMWCTRCRTCFSWNTGKKIHGTIHNPHYYEYLFQNRGGGEAPVEQVEDGYACNGFPEYHRLVRKWSQSDSIGKQDQILLNNIHRLANHLRYEEIHRLRTSITDHDALNTRKWSVEYLRNHVTREEWGQKLYVGHRKKERGQRMIHILDMFWMVSCDIYRNWYADTLSGSELLASLQRLLQYANENIHLHNKQYGTKAASLDPNTRLKQHIIQHS